MKKLIATLSCTLLGASAALAAPHSYQVSGQVLELNDKTIVISKGNDNWELKRDAQTRLPDDVQVGNRVTIEYTITAVDVTNKTPHTKSRKSAKDNLAAVKAVEANSKNKQ